MISPRARELHFRSLVLDGHQDTTQRLLDARFDLAGRHSDGHADIPRMREGGLGGAFFAAWVPGDVAGREAIERATAQIQAIRRHVLAHPRDLALCTCAGEIRRARAAGKIAILIGVEGGHMIANDLDALRSFHALGARYMTLVHNRNTDWADAANDAPQNRGLTPFGRDVIREMNRLGMLVDVSHVSDATFWQALDASRAPVIASHSSCRAVCDAPRNLSDEMIRALAAAGGVLHINFHVAFVNQSFRDTMRAHPEYEAAIEAELESRCGKDEGCRLLESFGLLRQFTEQGKLPPSGLGDVLAHFDHALRLAGPEHVGIGSDFDGAAMPAGMDDVSRLPEITQGLLCRGCAESDVVAVLGENTLRVLEEAEAAAE